MDRDTHLMTRKEANFINNKILRRRDNQLEIKAQTSTISKAEQEFKNSEQKCGTRGPFGRTKQQNLNQIQRWFVERMIHIDSKANHCQFCGRDRTGGVSSFQMKTAA